LKKEAPGVQSFNDVVTLKNIDFNVKRGEFVCIIGDVGSGKSSLLSALNGDLLLASDDLIVKFQDANLQQDKVLEDIQENLLMESNREKEQAPIIINGKTALV
jgi:ABC-type phosphate/phosphonate transport system ATPase subunit